MQGIEIIKLEGLKVDERGSIFEFENRETSKILLIKRKSGTVSGEHYHTGKNIKKDPEIIVLLDGQAKVTLINIKTKEKTEAVYQEPVMIKISPYIYHEVQALTDIVLLDMNSIKDDNDTIKDVFK